MSRRAGPRRLYARVLSKMRRRRKNKTAGVGPDGRVELARSVRPAGGRKTSKREDRCRRAAPEMMCYTRGGRAVGRDRVDIGCART